MPTAMSSQPTGGKFNPDVEELARALLSTKSDAIVAADTKGIITFWNPGRNVYLVIRARKP
jgi:PAS domain-containing protein